MDDELQQLLDERDVADLVVRLFVATDRRDWRAVEACLAERVTLDMTSMTGGEPLQKSGPELAALWEEGLRPIDHVHHQVGNLRVTVSGDEAKATCYGIALHHRKISGPRKTRVFVGSYDVRLRRQEGRWRIEAFRFDLAFLEGNLELEKAT
jgi:hypothetical protein